MDKKKKIRVELKKNRSHPPRDRDWTREFQDHGYTEKATSNDERVRAKGALSRKRTILQSGTNEDGLPSIDPTICRTGRVLRVHGLFSVIEDEQQRIWRCVVRRLLKSLLSDGRAVVTTGDQVWFRPAEASQLAQEAEGSISDDDARPLEEMPEGIIERVEPRHGVLTRASRGREHALVANVDQLAIIVSLFEPDLKPHLIDRYIACAVRGDLKPVICLNKADLAQAAAFQSLIGYYAQLGVPAILTSAITGQGIEFLRDHLRGRATVFSGQSGVGKSSLLNALQPGLALRVRTVSESTQKGRHTTTHSQMLRLDFGGWVVDTPGVRQLALWNTNAGEVEGLFSEFRPYVALCAFPDCIHIHEDGCAVLRAVRRRQISEQRYHSYCGLLSTADGE